MADRIGGVIDSDEDFSTPTPPEIVIPRKSKLSKKKNKNKENNKKPHTSTQMENPEPLMSRGGRPARKTAEEIKFLEELEEALRLSSEDISSSSAEIVPAANNRKDVVGNGDRFVDQASERSVVDDVNDILVVSDSQESVEFEHDITSARMFSLKNGKGDVMKVESDEEDIFVKKKKTKVIESDDEFETEVASKPTPAIKPCKADELTKKRKVEETWVVSEQKKIKNKSGVLKTTLKRFVEPIKKYTGDSSGSENLSGDDFDVNDAESDEEEFVPVKSSKRKTPVRKKTSKMSPLKSSVVPKSSPKKPLGSHNPIPSPSIPLPKSKNMFQNKSPIKLSYNPKSPAASSKQSSLTPKSFTPGPSSSISSLLKKFENQTKSTPIPGATSKSSVPSPSTPVQQKIPGWTPPARIGVPGSSSSTPGASPSIGLRLGLSRNFKSKPLHSGVKYP